MKLWECWCRAWLCIVVAETEAEALAEAQRLWEAGFEGTYEPSDWMITLHEENQFVVGWV